MATGPALLVLCCSALYVLFMADVTCGQCVAKFQFYGVTNTTTTTASTNSLTSTTTTSNTTLIIQEGSGLDVEFSVVTENCFNDMENPRDFVVAISKEDQNKGESRYVDFCKIIGLADGTCYLWQSKECGCVIDGMKVIYFIKREFWDSTDETKWRLKATSPSGSLEANAVINIELGCVAKFQFYGVTNTTTTTASTNSLTSTTTTPNTTLIIQEGSGLDIEFSVVTENCFNDMENPRDFVVAISKEDQNKGESRYVDFCKIIGLADGTCYLWQSKECGCVKDGMKVIYFIKREFWDSTDETKWRLKATSPSGSLEANAVINIELGYTHPFDTEDDVETNNDAEDGADAGDDVRKVALIVGSVIGAVLILSAVILILLLVKRNKSRRSYAMKADLNHMPLHHIHHPPPQLPTGGAIGGREVCGNLYDDPDDLRAIGPCPPPPPRPAVCAEDDGGDNDTTPADADYLHPVASSLTPLPDADYLHPVASSLTPLPDADYLHPVASSLTPLPAAGAESMYETPLPPPHPSTTKDEDQYTGIVYLLPQQQNKPRQPNDKLPKPPPP